MLLWNEMIEKNGNETFDKNNFLQLNDFVFSYVKMNANVLNR